MWYTGLKHHTQYIKKYSRRLRTMLGRRVGVVVTMGTLEVEGVTSGHCQRPSLPISEAILACAL